MAATTRELSASMISQQMSQSKLEAVYTPGTKTIRMYDFLVWTREEELVKALMFTTFDQDLNLLTTFVYLSEEIEMLT